MVIELEDGSKKRLEVESDLLCAAGRERSPEQSGYRIGTSTQDFASLALKCRVLHHRK